jgi:Spy/CpxP family protein refolding chaperone
MRNKSVILGSVLAASILGLAANSGAIAASGGAPGGDQRAGHEARGWHREGGMPRMFERLDLTQEQREQVNQIVNEGKQARQDKKKALWESRKALRDQAMADAYDAQRVQELADQQAKLDAELIVMRTETFHRIYSVLTPDQKQKLAEMKQQRKDHRRKHSNRS